MNLQGCPSGRCLRVGGIRDVLSLALPWHCATGFILFVSLAGALMDRMQVEYPYARAIGLGCAVDAARQIRIGTRRLGRSERGAANLVLAIGYSLIAWPVLGPHEPAASAWPWLTAVLAGSGVCAGWVAWAVFSARRCITPVPERATVGDGSDPQPQ
jgi:hypothetical protein